MLQFTSLPAIPADYPRLEALTSTELGFARADSYIADTVDASASVNRAGVDFGLQPLTANTLTDWRTKVYLIWFCYVYENLQIIAKPMGAIEELILEFKAPSILDTENARLGTLYAGAGASDPLTSEDLLQETIRLKPLYDEAVTLLNLIRVSD